MNKDIIDEGLNGKIKSIIEDILESLSNVSSFILCKQY